MKIYSMTATFGKLEHETIRFQPGLNVIQAPNEWGKSTWCAFLTAMLYGIETRVHTTKTSLADKERYAPWSGSPMSGRIDLCWNGRDITIERRSKGRSVFCVFRAYETDTGLDVAELTAANCGEMLLGVEKSVFVRSGFIRLSDMPVTQDDSLRRRLNAIVTTGDESGTADTLAQKLKDLKNRCRLNRSTGLLPQAEAKQRELRDKLSELRELQGQSQRTQQRLQQLEQHHRELLNHQAALRSAASKTHSEKLSAAEAALKEAEQKVALLSAQCEGLPDPEMVERMLPRLRQLREAQDALHMDLQFSSPQPQAPEVYPVFRDMDPQTAIDQARVSQEVYAQDSKSKPFPWYCILGLLLGIAALFIPHWAGKAAGGVLIAAALLLLRVYWTDARRRENTLRSLRYQYQPIPPENWVTAAEQHARQQAEYQQAMETYRTERDSLQTRAEALRAQTRELTQDRTLPECEAFYTHAQAAHSTLAEARREQHRAQELAQALRSSRADAPEPEFPDTMTYTEQDTARLLSDCALEQRELQRSLGNTQGRMEALGREDVLRQQLDAVCQRISALETTYAALELAQSTLADASAQLQRRFAPRISRQAQAYFEKLTGGRYTRLTLAEDLSVHAGTGEEDTLHSALWRSDGTVDQLYLALRLAVAGELTPAAPLILDDALVRFDDKRLKEALDVLAEEAQSKQVILFTCHSRESQLAGNDKM